MISERWITEEDKTILKDSLDKDIYHKGTTPEFFYAPGSFCKVYEDETSPIFYVRGTKSIRIDIQFVSNTDYKRNREVFLTKFPEFVQACRNAGFMEIVFETNSPLLKRFCIQTLGFREIKNDELVYTV